MEERQVEQWKDLENIKQGKLNSEMKWKIGKKSKLNSEMLLKIQKKIVKRYENMDEK